jgi:hypothetical protein
MTDDKWLERALRAHEPRLDDDGFTLRVMGALPPARARRGARTDWIVVGRAAVGSAAAASQFPLAPFLKVADLVLQNAHIVWIGGAVMLACMAGALLSEPLRRAL